MVASTEREPAPQQQAECAAQEGPSFKAIAEDVRLRLFEFGEYVSYLVSLQVDRLSLQGKRIGLYAVAGVLGLMVLSSVLMVGTALLLVGLAGLIGYAVNSFWLGATIVGAGLFILVAAGALLAWRYLNTSAVKKLRLKYAERRQKQTRVYGRNIKEVAHA